MAKRYHDPICFSHSKRRAVEAEFTGAEVTDKGGAMLLAEADRRMGLTQAATDAIGDDRRFSVSGHSRPFWTSAGYGGGGSRARSRSDRRGRSANSVFQTLGVSSTTRLAGCRPTRWRTSTR